MPRRLIRSLAIPLIALALILPCALAPHAEAATPRFLYRTHVDAAHIAWEKDRPIIKVVDGTKPVPSDSGIVRLGPDADSSGNETSRYQIPADKNQAFLGKVGDIVWHSPTVLNDTWSPVWAGFGTGAFPDDTLSTIKPERTKLRLVKVDGPGVVEVFGVEPSTGVVTRAFSSGDGPKESLMPPGSHGHFTWTFTKSGVYKIYWQGVVEKRDGSFLEGPAMPVTWYVGTDKDLGLAEGTTTRSPIKKFVANTVPAGLSFIAGDQKPSAEPSAAPSTAAPTLSPTVPPTSTPSEDGNDPGKSNPTNELEVCHRVAPVDLGVASTWDGEKDDSDVPNAPNVILNAGGKKLKDYESVVDVPDQWKKPFPKSNSANHLIPAGQLAYQIPAFAMDTAKVAEPKDLFETIYQLESDADHAGRILIGHRDASGEFVLDVDSTNSASMLIRMNPK